METEETEVSEWGSVERDEEVEADEDEDEVEVEPVEVSRKK